MRSKFIICSLLLILGMPCFGFKEEVDTETSAIKLTFDNFVGGDFRFKDGDVNSNVWQFSNGMTPTPGCIIETLMYDVFGNQNTKRGSIDVSLKFKRYSWYGSIFAHDNLPLIAVRVNYSDIYGMKSTHPHIVPIRSLSRFYQFEDYIRAMESNWVVNIPAVSFQEEIFDIKVQICSIASGSIIELQSIVMRLSDG